MQSRKSNPIVISLPAFFATAMLCAAELPASFPPDVPIAEYMQVKNVTQVRDDLMIDLHAPDQTLQDVIDWFKSGLAAAGWNSDGETLLPRSAILAYSKDGRKCGVSITNFVMNEAMQMDESIKGITLQISGADDPAPGAASATASGAAQQSQD